MIFVQRVLVDVKTLFIVVGHGIDNARMVLEARLATQSPDSGLCCDERSVDADHLHILLPVWTDAQMLNYENGIHDF